MANPTIDIDIHLRDLRHFFSTPEIDPFEGEAIDESGIDQIVDTLKGGFIHRRRKVRVRLHIPASQPPSPLIPRLGEALAVYCEQHVQYSRRKLREVKADGLRALGVGVLFLALCIGLAAGIEKVIGSGSFSGRFLVEGAVIAGWVGLWRPIEILLFDWWPYAMDMQLYREMRDMEIEVRAV